MLYIAMKYSGNPRKVNFSPKVITSTLLLKLNLLFQLLISKVNDFDLKQYSFLAQYTCMHLCSIESYLQKLVTVSSIQEELIKYLPQFKAIFENKSCAVSNLFLCLNCQLNFIHYNSRFVNEK